MKFRILLAATLLYASAQPVPAFACSVIDSYRVPTNLELAGNAELIVLGKITAGKPMGDGGMDSMAITVQPLSAIKGALPAEPIELKGLALAPARFAVLSNPYELEAAHPLSYIGGCIRYMFPAGTTALFFLKKRDGQWAPAGGPFSRWAEDVLDPTGPWPTLTALYVKAAALTLAERKTLLEAERARYAAMAQDPIAALMAADISRQLKGPNPTWNKQMDDAMINDGPHR